MPTAPPAAGKPECLDPPGQREIGRAAAGSRLCPDHRTSPVPLLGAQPLPAGFQGALDHCLSSEG